jgi:hypothetical protein
VGKLLEVASEQTGVRLSAQEPELQSRDLTVAVPVLPLNALMTQLARVLDACWYEWDTADGRNYTITRGSRAAVSKQVGVGGAHEVFERTRRRTRVEDYLATWQLSDSELEKRLPTDPTLVSSLAGCSNAYNRRAVEIMAQARQSTLREFTQAGSVDLGIDELPPWYQDVLRREYSATREQLGPLGITSADQFIRQFRVRFYDAGEFPKTEAEANTALATTGRLWLGIGWVTGLAAPSDTAGQAMLASRPEWKGLLPMVIGGADNPRGYGELLGGSDDPQGLVDLYQKPGETIEDYVRRLDTVVVDARAQRESRLQECYWKDDPQLSRVPLFDLAPSMTAAQVLGQVADQTNYSVLAAFDRGGDSVLPHEVSPHEPLYVLLNRVANAEGCNWLLAGQVIVWRCDALFDSDGVAPGK